MSTSLVERSAVDFPRRWYPVAIAEADTAPQICWQYFGDCRFTQPFFEDTLASARHGPDYACRTAPEALARFNPDDCLAPAAFVFHASRSGSTLVAQMLAALSRCIVISEAPVIEAALKLCRVDATRKPGLEILAGVVRALGQRRSADEQHLFIKLDSWLITHLPLIRQVFPGSPCFFIYRHPAEILASHRKVRGSQMVPGLIDAAALGLAPAALESTDLDDFCRQVLSSFFQSAKRHAVSGSVRLINYNQLPAVIWTHFLPDLSIPLESAELRLIQERSLRNSKRPGELFVEPVCKMHDDALASLNADYADLERLRWIPNTQRDPG